MAAPLRRRPEPGEDFEDFLSSPTRSNSEPQLRASPTRAVTAVASPFIPGLKRGGERFSQFLRDDFRDEEESPSQALSSMVERLYDEELRKREERRMARTMEREQEFAKQAPFAPRIRAPRRSRNDKVERHLILYDKHLEMAQKRRDKQEQKLRDEQEYLERHSVHRTASSPRSPQASDAAVYQRLHEEAELKRQRLEQREKAAKTPSSPTRASSMTNMRLFQMASEVAEKRQKLQERKMKEEWDYLQMHSIHRAKSPQADTSRISQRLYEEAEIKKQRLHEMQREKDLKEDRLFASKTGANAPKDPKSIVQRLYAPESRKKTWAEKEEEQRWLRERQERRPVPRRAASQGPFRRVEPGDSPKAIAESQGTRVPGNSNQVTVAASVAAETAAEEVVPAPEPAEEAESSVPTPEQIKEAESSVPTPEQIKAFCQFTEALVSSPLEVPMVEAEAAPSISAVPTAEQIEAAELPAVPAAASQDSPSTFMPTVDQIEAAPSICMPTADQIKAFCESTQALVESTKDVQAPPEGSELSEAARRLSLELDECF